MVRRQQSLQQHGSGGWAEKTAVKVNAHGHILVLASVSTGATARFQPPAQSRSMPRPQAVPMEANRGHRELLDAAEAAERTARTCTTEEACKADARAMTRCGRTTGAAD